MQKKEMLVRIATQEDENSGIKDVKILTGKENVKAIKAYEKAGYKQKNGVVFQKKMT